MVLITLSPGRVQVQLAGLDVREEQEAARLFAKVAPAVEELRRLVGGRRRDRESVMSQNLGALR